VGVNAVMFPNGIMVSTVSVSTPEELGAALKAARTARGLRLEDLALAAGVGRRFLGELERGKPTVRLAETLRVAQALGVSITMNDPHA
jgi:HTH-type transcriptional regulator / antitoxin HipB